MQPLKDDAVLQGHELGACPDVARLLRPRIRLLQELVWIDEGELGAGDDYRERSLPAISLSFDYDGFSVRASDPRRRIFCGRDTSFAALERDHDAETRARHLLESFGAIEIEALEDLATAPGSQVDYLVQMEGDQHSHCAFTAYAVPQLKALGFEVELDDAYPYRVVSDEPPWYACMAPLDKKPDWFSLELGVEIEGHRVNLLPVLLELVRGGLRLSGSFDAKRPRFVKLPGSEGYLAVPPDRLRTLVQVVAELYQGKGDTRARTIAFPGLRAGALERLDRAFDHGAALRWQGGREIRQRARALDQRARSPDPGALDAAAGPGPTPALLQATLRPYQAAGVAWLRGLRDFGGAGVLADDMGLGKTLQTIALLCLDKQQGCSDRPSLVVAPTSLIGNWKREFARFAPALRCLSLHGPRRFAERARVSHADVVVTSYPVLLRDESFFAERPFRYLILDEAQAIKNRGSRASALVRALRADHRLCLTGTPIENNLSELWSLFDFLMPGLLGSELQFKHFFRIPIEEHGDDHRLRALRDQVAPYILRRMKDEVLKELPPKTELVLPVELTGKQRELYESIRVAAHSKVRSAISKRGLAASTVTIFDALMRLRQLCCDPRLVRGEAARFVRESAKYEALMELLPNQHRDGRRILLFSQFTSMLALIAQGLEARGLGYAKLTGRTRDRDAAVHRFESGRADIFLISLKAGGTGLNLVSADTVVHYDPWWNPAAQDQATDRAYRIGQTKPVFVYNLIAAGSVEERMLALQQQKRRLAQTIVSGNQRREGILSEGEVEHLLSPLE